MAPNLIFHTAAQGSLDWHTARAGRVTSSTCAPLLTKPGKGSRAGLSAGCWTLVYQLAADLTYPDPYPDGGYTSRSMDRGHREEPRARREYANRVFPLEVHEVGFVEVDGRLAGFSADALTGPLEAPTGGAEIKCLEAPGHYAWLEEKKTPKSHLAQVNWCMFCAGLKSWDFVHYHPDFRRGLGRMDVKTMEPDPLLQERFAEALPLIEREVKRIIEKYHPERAQAPTFAPT